MTRRDVLVRAAHGFGSLALASLLPAAQPTVNPLAAKPPHFAAQGEVGDLPVHGGRPSQIDTFDPKPALEKFNGQPLPDSYGKVVSQFTKGDTPLLRSPWTFKKHGQCGTGGLDAVSAHGAVRRRHLLRAELLHGQHGARAGDVPGATPGAS